MSKAVCALLWFCVLLRIEVFSLITFSFPLSTKSHLLSSTPALFLRHLAQVSSLTSCLAVLEDMGHSAHSASPVTYGSVDDAS